MAVGVGGGSYRFDGLVLTEVYEYSSPGELVGRQLTLAIKFQSPDDFTQTGMTNQPGISQDESYHRRTASRSSSSLP
jgi:hypothetical protein